MTEPQDPIPVVPRDAERVAAARRLFTEHGIEELQALDEWDGHDLERFRGVLTEEEFQLLCDGLQDWDDGRPS
jgi:hypothetical protein